MAASYDDQGNYLYPEGFDPETGEWLEGYEEQRAAWEQQYAEAHARWEAHKKQVEDADGAAAPPSSSSSSSSSYSSDAVPVPTPAGPEGSLASDEALQALRQKLTGGN
jgi:small subunit ribosomal protein S1